MNNKIANDFGFFSCDEYKKSDCKALYILAFYCPTDEDDDGVGNEWVLLATDDTEEAITMYINNCKMEKDDLKHRLFKLDCNDFQYKDVSFWEKCKKDPKKKNKTKKVVVNENGDVCLCDYEGKAKYLIAYSAPINETAAAAGIWFYHEWLDFATDDICKAIDRYIANCNKSIAPHFYELKGDIYERKIIHL